MSIEDQIKLDVQLAEIVRRLVVDFMPEKVYLFGSRARGSQNTASDYDLLVVMPSLNGPAYRYSQRACETLSGIAAPTDVLFISKEKFDYWRDTLGTLAELVSRQGKELYVAAA